MIGLTLSDASGVPYWRQIRDQLARQIRDGELAPGSALLSVRKLATSLRVSVITTRRAYAELESAGLIFSRQGRGTFVSETIAPRDDDAVAEARSAFANALDRARGLGLDDDDVRALVEDLISGDKA
ncbi:MAG: GntR family transcriptional regulator [Proteobacteria bacterium]|nr:GntR family transcriptional regulator [Pseudomonadota bacterium]